jgi:hypothetical protein
MGPIKRPQNGGRIRTFFGIRFGAPTCEPREAQIWPLKDGKPLRGLDIPVEKANPSKRLLPKYWAAFVISGDWR